MDFGYTFEYQPDSPQNNTVMFEDCLFLENAAQFGGGISIDTKPSKNPISQNYIGFKDCNWTENTGSYGYIT